MSDATYLSLRDKTDHALANGESVVVDASFAAVRHREIFRSLGAKHGILTLLVHLRCDENILLERLARRESQGDDISDGRRELLSAQADLFEPAAEFTNIIEIDSTKEIDYNAGLTLAKILMEKSRFR